MKKIYVELIFLDNFLIDFLLVYLAARFSERKVSFGRVSLGAAIGGVYGVCCAACAPLGSPLVKVAAAFLMCLPLSPKPRKSYMRKVGVLYAGSFLLGGILFFLLEGRAKGGVLYINTPIFRYLLGGSALLVVLLECLLRYSHPEKNTIYQVRFEVKGERVLLPAFLDTGNRLKDASGAGVIVANKEKLLSQLSPSAQNALLSSSIPFRLTTVSGAGELMAFMPDTLTISDKRHTYLAKAYIALSDAFSGEKFDAALAADIRLLKN